MKAYTSQGISEKMVSKHIHTSNLRKDGVMGLHLEVTRYKKKY